MSAAGQRQPAHQDKQHLQHMELLSSYAQGIKGPSSGADFSERRAGGPNLLPACYLFAIAWHAIACDNPLGVRCVLSPKADA